MILDKFKIRARDKTANIGIGLGDIETHNLKILFASIQFIVQNNSKVFLFGTNKSINQLSNNASYQKNENNIVLVESNEPENEIFEHLNKKKINAVVRGSFSSSKFLKNLKEFLNVSDIMRLALLETFGGFQFFYGPVGIDECNTYEKKLDFVIKSITELESLEIDPIISILSGGRKDDLGRDEKVDKSIEIAENLVTNLKKQYPKYFIFHDEIMIESSINREANLIVAPEGISGNLIYRTLVHLGGGKAYGAIYLDIDKTIIDTSRVGKVSEIQGALLLALALTP